MIKRTLYVASICTAMILSVGLSQGHAQLKQLNIGYVNPQTILTKMPEFKAVQQKMQNYVDKKRKELGQQQQNLDKQISDYQKKQSVISEDAQKKEETRLGKLQADFQAAQQKAQQEIGKKRQDLVGPLLEQINTAIKSVAKRKGLTYVFNTTTSSNDVIILYASPEAQKKYDITDEVMNELGI